MAQSTGLKAIITGATSGIGFHTLKRLACSGSFDYILGIGRDCTKCNEEFSETNSLAQSTTIEFVSCDLTKVDEVKDLCVSIGSRMPRIDLLINVAGIMDAPKTFTDYGVELHFAANHLGHFLLTKSLLKHMANEGRIVNVTSGLYTKCVDGPTWESVHPPAADSAPDMSPRSYYSQSKLANCLFTVALNNYIKQNQDKLPHVGVFAVRPGFIRGTELGRYHNRYLRGLAWPLIYFFSKDLDFGTDTIIHLSLAQFEELESGRLYHDKKLENYSDLVTNEAAKRLWELSEKLLESSEATTVSGQQDTSKKRSLETS